MKKKHIYFIAFGILLLANAPFINKFILFKVDNSSFAYSNVNGFYTNRESFGFKDPTFTGFSFNYFIQEYDTFPLFIEQGARLPEQNFVPS